MKVGIVGATGMVGKTFLTLLAERKFPVTDLKLFASDASVGQNLIFQNKNIPLQTLKSEAFTGLDLVFFSSGDTISTEWAPQAVKAGALVIDNSAAFRADPHCHLMVPEVNGDLLEFPCQPQIIANPNCSTIQLVMTLKPLDIAFDVESVKVASYQAVSGAGQAGYDELLQQIQDYKNPNPPIKAFPHPILFNVIPQIGDFDDAGFCVEENKIRTETKKILIRPELPVSVFTVRVPALNSHSEVVWVRLKKKVEKFEILRVFEKAPGLVLEDDIKRSGYPTPRKVSGQDPVFVGRIHRDLEDPYLWILWIVSDNLKKGAALNAIQIAEKAFKLS